MKQLSVQLKLIKMSLMLGLGTHISCIYQLLLIYSILIKNQYLFYYLLRVIDNSSPGFDKKIEKVIIAVEKFIGI